MNRELPGADAAISSRTCRAPPCRARAPIRSERMQEKAEEDAEEDANGEQKQKQQDYHAQAQDHYSSTSAANERHFRAFA